MEPADVCGSGFRPRGLCLPGKHSTVKLHTAASLTIDLEWFCLSQGRSLAIGFLFQVLPFLGLYYVPLSLLLFPYLLLVSIYSAFTYLPSNNYAAIDKAQENLFDLGKVPFQEGFFFFKGKSLVCIYTQVDLRPKAGRPSEFRASPSYLARPYLSKNSEKEKILGSQSTQVSQGSHERLIEKSTFDLEEELSICYLRVNLGKERENVQRLMWQHHGYSRSNCEFLC